MDTKLKKAFDILRTVPVQSRIQVVKGCSVRRKENGQVIMSLHYSAIPERDPDTPEGAKWKKRARAAYSSEARWKQEQEIDAYAAGGEAVFASILSDPECYRRVVISDPYWQPDPTWDVVFGFDHGKRNATCLLKAYITRPKPDPATGVTKPFDIYVAGEFYSMQRGPSAAEPAGWMNNIDQNVILMKEMPDIGRARWIMADPSIFYETQAQSKGSYTKIVAEYKKAGMPTILEYEGTRSDITFVEWMLSDYWRGVAQGMQPRLFIVCRNPSEKPLPGLHPYDCPNLLWELKRAKRVEMTARQLLVKNQSDALVDKDNHARDAFKYLTGTIRRPARKPFKEELDEELKKLTDPTTQQIRARHLFSEAAMKGKITWDGKEKRGHPIVSMRGNKRPRLFRRGF